MRDSDVAATEVNAGCVVARTVVTVVTTESVVTEETVVFPPLSDDVALSKIADVVTGKVKGVVSSNVTSEVVLTGIVTLSADDVVLRTVTGVVTEKLNDVVSSMVTLETVLRGIVT